MLYVVVRERLGYVEDLSTLEYWKHADSSDLDMRERLPAQWRCSRLARHRASLGAGQEEGMLWSRTVTTSGRSSLKLYVLTGEVLICYFHVAFVSSLGPLVSFKAEVQCAGVSAVLSLSRAVRVWLQQGCGQPEPASPASHSSHLCVLSATAAVLPHELEHGQSSWVYCEHSKLVYLYSWLVWLSAQPGQM